MGCEIVVGVDISREITGIIGICHFTGEIVVSGDGFFKEIAGIIGIGNFTGEVIVCGGGNSKGNRRNL